MGTRTRIADVDGKPAFGDYLWRTYEEVQQIAQKLARGIRKLGLVVETQGDDRRWNFVGVWSKNRQEWLTAHLANMYFSYTTIGFFDSMGADQVDYIIKQTELSCVFTEAAYV